ncbi:ribosomal protein S5 domain 2-like protein [Camillea tinctor]|nr:ribosomal protein S5 domain 2-like protein [Camillea tinctor]
MPLDTSSAYPLALLRVDGRRWNDLRRLHAAVRTQAAADGSAYLEMGNTKVMCTVTGPSEENKRRTAASTATGNTGGAGGGAGAGGAEVAVEIVVGGFSSVDRKRRGRGDKRIHELQTTLSKALAAALHTHLYPRSTIALSLHVLSQDGSLLAALLNASTLALVDAGIPMSDLPVACTAGLTSAASAADDPLVDLNAQEEQELPFLTLATLGDTDRVMVLVLETRVQAARLKDMVDLAADACKSVHKSLREVVRRRGEHMVEEGAVEKGASMAMDMDIDV